MILATKEWVIDFIRKTLKKGNEDRFFSTGMDSKVIVTKAKISSTGAYITTGGFSENPFNNYEYLCAYVTVPSIGGTYKTMANIVARGDITMTVAGPSATGNISFYVNGSSVKGTGYSGSWREIYVTLIAYRTPAYSLMMQDYKTHTE